VSSPPVAIRVTDVHKTFRLPKERMHTLKERALHPLRRKRFDEFHVLRGLDLEVQQGEFFGIVGRNGSGKSTLLKCLAGIYRIDSGEIWVAGRLSPFIELGVGFNPELTARDNVLINAVMMGLTAREARERLADIIAFAELEGFVDQKLKNYSSGMQVRLAFSVMVQSDPDVMLIDEVLAVGDAAFQQRCIDVFYRLRNEGKTIVLVTHDMGLVDRFCHRAIMISGGLITHRGDPKEIGRAYLSENFRTYSGDHPQAPDTDEVRVLDAWVGNSNDEQVDAISYGERMHIHLTLEATAPVHDPGLSIWLSNEDGVRIFSVGARENGEGLSNLHAGERLELSVETDNIFTAGRYYLGCGLTQGTAGLEVLLFQSRVADIVSYGADVHGVVGVGYEATLHRTRAGREAMA
jgi:ABC-type polysaccharide/polyol phosphate transport system ATPase subunit